MEQTIINISTSSDEFRKERILSRYHLKSHHNLYSSEKFKDVPDKTKEKIFDLVEDLTTFNSIISNKFFQRESKIRIEDKNLNLESLVYSLNCSLIIRDFFNDQNNREKLEIKPNINNIDDFIQYYLLFSKSFKEVEKKKSQYTKSLDFFYDVSKKYTKKYFEEPTKDFILKVNGNFIFLPKSEPINKFELIDNEVNNIFNSDSYCKEKIVGNEELVNKIKLGIRYLMFYNSTNKKNELDEIMKFFSVLFVYGAPGCGKTLAIKNSINELKYLAKKFNKKYSIIELNNTFKSGIFNESVKNLNYIDKQIKKGDKSYLILADDIDTVFFPRTNSNHSTEERKIFGEMLRILEGVQENKLGNSFLIATSNSPDSIDNALLQRLNKNSVYVYGPSSSEEYQEIFLNKLKKGINKGYIKIKNWEKIGSISNNLNIGGRGVENICSRIVENVIDYKKLDEFFFNNDCALLESIAPKLISTLNTIDDFILINKIVRYDQEIKNQQNNFVVNNKKFDNKKTI